MCAWGSLTVRMQDDAVHFLCQCWFFRFSCGFLKLHHLLCLLPWNMLGTSDIESLRNIESHLNWNTDSKIRHRMPRRPRASFLGDSKQKFCIRHVGRLQNAFVDVLKSEEMPVTESEKLGVSILGHRFDGSLEGLPIKKRLLIGHSPSSSRDSLPISLETSDYLFETLGSHIVSRNQDHALNPTTPFDGADFSGISILAAAACSGYFDGENINSEPSVYKDEHINPHKGLNDAELSDGKAQDDEISLVEPHEKIYADASENKADIPDSSVAVVGMPAAEDGSCNGDASFLCVNQSSNDGHLKQNEDFDVINTSICHKLHWDLNKLMDAWEFPDEGPGFIGGPDDDVVCKEDSDKHETTLDSVDARMETINEVISDDLFKDTRFQEIDGTYNICNDPRSSTYSIMCGHGSSHAANVPKTIEETKYQNQMQNCISAEKAMCILPKSHLFQQEPSNPSSSLSNSNVRSIATGELGDFIKADLQSACGEPTDEQLSDRLFDSASVQAVCTVSGCATVQEASQVEVNDCISPKSHLFQQEPSCPSSSLSNLNVRSIATGELDDFMKVDLQSSCGEPVQALCPASGCATVREVSQVEVYDCNADSHEIVATDIVIQKKISNYDDNVEFIHHDKDGLIAGVRNEHLDTAKNHSCHSAQPGEALDDSLSSREIQPSTTYYSKGASLNVDRCDIDDVYTCNVSSSAVLLSNDVDTAVNVASSAVLLSNAAGSVVNVPFSQAENCHSSKPIPATVFSCVNNAKSLNAHAVDQENVDTGDKDDVIACGVASAAVSFSNDTSTVVDNVSFHVSCESKTAVRDVQVETEPRKYLSGHPTEVEKIDLDIDDDSQYEDGELRDYALPDWQLDSDSYGDDENVDYESEDREMAMHENAFDSPDHSEFESSKTVVEVPLENWCKTPVADQVSHRNLEVESKKKLEYACVGEVKRTDLIVERHNRKDSHTSPGKSDQEIVTATHIGISPIRDAKEISGGIEVGSSSNGEIIDASGAVSGESKKKISDSKHLRDLSWRLVKERSSEISYGTNGTCYPGSGINKNVDENHIAKDARACTQFLRNVGPIHKRERQRYYDSTSFVQQTAKNPVQAAAAKVESNGFAVAPDGTVVEPNHLEPNSWSSRRNSSAHAAYASFTGKLSTGGRDSLSSSERDDDLAIISQSKPIFRVASPGKHSNDEEVSYSCEPRMPYVCRNEYYGMQVLADRVDLPCHRIPSQRGHRSPCGRNHNSPFRRETSVPRYQGISHSRSRSRSPAWIPPMRNGGRVVEHHGLRHRDGSPPDLRVERIKLVKLGSQRGYYSDRLSDFIPSYRDYPGQTIHERRDLDNKLRKSENKIFRRSLDKGSPEHLLSQNHRFNVMDSRRTDNEDYCRQVHRGRNNESSCKRPRFRDYDERRDHDHRYEVLLPPPTRQYALQHDNVNRYRSENPRPKLDSEFEELDGMQSFLGGHKGRENQFGGLLNRSNGEKGRFRYGRELRRGANYRSSGIMPCDKESDPVRKRPS